MRKDKISLPSAEVIVKAMMVEGICLITTLAAGLHSRFPYKVQKISVNAGFSCPNRDGRIGFGGCTFCDNNTFNPSYCDSRKSVAEQLEVGKRFFSRKYPDMRYLAYFQAYTNTYAPLDSLKRMYEEALSVENVVGLVIGTRPDCVDPQMLDYLGELSRQTFVIVEYGVESTNDETLKRINRGHTFECSRRAIEETAGRGIITGGMLFSDCRARTVWKTCIRLSTFPQQSCTS